MPIFPNGSSRAHQREQQEKQACDLEPENVYHAANVARGDVTGVIKGPDPAILACPVPRHSQERATLPAETTRGQKTSFL
jgi:hypothetical protein